MLVRVSESARVRPLSLAERALTTAPAPVLVLLASPSAGAPNISAPVGFVRLSAASARRASSKCTSMIHRRALRYGQKP